MLDDLLAAKRISVEQYEIYILFHVNELGRKTLERMTMAYFMEEPQNTEFKGTGFAFYDGRRSVFRDIYRAINFVSKKLKEAEDDNLGRPKAE
jgi:hypothetical protein